MKIKWQTADVTFDPETAHPYLIVSEDGKEVRDTDTRQRVTDNPKRFDRSPCVLAREGFTSGRHYWEVEVGGKTAWDLGVARESVNRKGDISLCDVTCWWSVLMTLRCPLCDIKRLRGREECELSRRNLRP
uniref:B30.2/SPRY domain-containing protein n=1 Tax=Erpetoichthys calabaricus TaxID=27687 RepID=A0A8C4SUQ4_ERPCA